jgi:ribosome maturation protein Sdo1
VGKENSQINKIIIKKGEIKTTKKKKKRKKKEKKTTKEIQMIARSFFKSI